MTHRGSMHAITHASPRHHRLVSSSDGNIGVALASAPAPATLSSNTTAPEATPVEVVVAPRPATAPPPLQQLVPSAPAATTAARAAAESFPVSLCTTSLKLAWSVLTSLVTMCFTFTCCRWCIVGRLAPALVVASAGAGGGPHGPPPPPPLLGWPSMSGRDVVSSSR